MNTMRMFGFDPAHHIGIDRRSFEHGDALDHRVGVDRRADFDVDAYHAAFTHRLEKQSVEAQRAAAGDTGLDDDVGLLLHHLRQHHR